MRSVLAALAALLLALPIEASAEERITRFISDVQIQPDASLDVAETIDVRAEGNRINHGIYRDFPTRYRGRNGSQVRVGFTLRDVTRDGLPEPTVIEPSRTACGSASAMPRKPSSRATTLCDPLSHHAQIGPFPL